MELKGTVEIEETYYKRSLELAFTDEFFDDVQLEGEPESISVEEDE